MGVRPINWSSESVKVTHKIDCHTGLPRFSGGHVWMGELDHKKAENQIVMLLNCGGGEDS